MRRVTRICLVLFGLASASGTSAWAEGPYVCQACQEKLLQQQQQTRHNTMFRAPRMCANCMRAQQMANGGPLAGPPMLIASNGGCVSCLPQAANAGMMPGYAMTGQPMPSNEPTPIGVMQASYRPASGVDNSAPGHAVSGGVLSPNDPAAFTNGRYVNTLAPPTHNRPRVLLHLLGLRTPGSMREEWAAKAKEAHASIPYGPYRETLTEVPASLVYGH
jgi:hypothetical protein